MPYADPEKAKEAERLRYQANREAILARARARYNANKDVLKAKVLDRQREKRDEYLEYQRKYASQNLERNSERKRAWRAANAERDRATARRNGAQWRESNRAEYNAKQRVRNAHMKPPGWADLDAIVAVYEEVKRLTRETGIPHHVDHIIPLQGKTVCGLHVAENLQILTAAENCRKSNRFDERGT